jgi:hypothetical protein
VKMFSQTIWGVHVTWRRRPTHEKKKRTSFFAGLQIDFLILLEFFFFSSAAERKNWGLEGKRLVIGTKIFDWRAWLFALAQTDGGVWSKILRKCQNARRGRASCRPTESLEVSKHCTKSITNLRHELCRVEDKQATAEGLCLPPGGKNRFGKFSVEKFNENPWLSWASRWKK